MQEFITVSMLNSNISRILDQDEILQDFWLKGEISGYRFYKQSGHSYFSIKDDNAVVSCVMFKNRAQSIEFHPEDGMEVLLRGYVSVYARQGKYQVYVQDMLPFGTGSLYLYLEQLKVRLAALGYFESGRKREIPRITNTIGVVTSQDGAALQDILRVIRLRHPAAQVVLVHSAVQGSDAPRELAAGIRMLNEYGAIDVILIARGGGSFEDLMAFNSEDVVQAVFDSTIPVISGVGHEVDVTLCDLVADMRAATPTQAAQFAVPDYTSVMRKMQDLNIRMGRSMQRNLANRTERLDCSLMKKVWREPRLLVKKQTEMLQVCRQRMDAAMQHDMRMTRHRLSLALRGLDDMSPLRVLDRGYTIATKEDKVVRNIVGVNEGDRLNIDLIDGRLTVLIEGKEKVDRWKS